MSGQVGDKSRFNRLRKQKLHRRERNRAFSAALQEQQGSPKTTASTSKKASQ